MQLIIRSWQRRTKNKRTDIMLLVIGQTFVIFSLTCSVTMKVVWISSVPDQSKKQVSFFNKQEDNNTVPCFPYAFAYNEGELSVLTDSGVDDSDTSLLWIINKVVPKLIKWMETAVKTKAGDSPSLRLVSVAQYSALYNQLKETYGKALVQVCLTHAVL